MKLTGNGLGRKLLVTVMYILCMISVYTYLWQFCSLAIFFILVLTHKLQHAFPSTQNIGLNTAPHTLLMVMSKMTNSARPVCLAAAAMLSNLTNTFGFPGKSKGHACTTLNMLARMAILSTFVDIFC